MKSEKNKSIKIDVTKIPPEVGERIGRVFLGYYKRFQQDPKLMAELEARRANRCHLPGGAVPDSPEKIGESEER